MAHPSARASRLNPFATIRFRTTGLLTVLWFAYGLPSQIPILTLAHFLSKPSQSTCAAAHAALNFAIRFACIQISQPPLSSVNQLFDQSNNSLSLLVGECWPFKGRHAPHDGMAHSNSKPNSLVWWLKESKYSHNGIRHNRLCHNSLHFYGIRHNRLCRCICIAPVIVCEQQNNTEPVV